jgi:hypothetical protein
MSRWASLVVALACAGAAGFAQGDPQSASDEPGAQKPGGAQSGSAPKPITMTIEGCLYEVSGDATPGELPGTSPNQTTLYVLTNVDRSGSQPGGRPAIGTSGDAKPAGRASDSAPEAAVGTRTPGSTDGRERSSTDKDADSGDRLRILFANDTEAKALVGRRVQLSGRLSPESEEERAAAREVLDPGAAPARDARSEREDDRDRPIPQFHAEAISPVQGSCATAPR